MTVLCLTLLLRAATVGGCGAGQAGAARMSPLPSHDQSRYEGFCDAAAAVALGPSHFVVADDERNTLVTYQRGQAAPVALLDLGSLRPEALFEVPGTHELRLLSDDASISTAGLACDERPPGAEGFSQPDAETALTQVRPGV
jgi:hypothetical protein